MSREVTQVLPISGGMCYFQFGDFDVETPKQRLQGTKEK